MKKAILIIILSFLTISCKNKEFIVMLEQPSEPQMDNIIVSIQVDNLAEYKDTLKSTNITPTYVSNRIDIDIDGNHLLKIKINKQIFKYSLSYPDDKYIIISPFLKRNGEIEIGLIKQKKEFVFH